VVSKGWISTNGSLYALNSILLPSGETAEYKARSIHCTLRDLLATNIYTGRKKTGRHKYFV